MPKKKNEENIDAALAAKTTETDPVEATPADEKPKRTRKADSATVESSDKPASATAAGKKSGKRAEKVGIVASDKMTKTVVVRVDRLVKHPVYRKYVKRRKKFMSVDLSRRPNTILLFLEAAISPSR